MLTRELTVFFLVFFLPFLPLSITVPGCLNWRQSFLARSSRSPPPLLAATECWFISSFSLALHLNDRSFLPTLVQEPSWWPTCLASYALCQMHEPLALLLKTDSHLLGCPTVREPLSLMPSTMQNHLMVGPSLLNTSKAITATCLYTPLCCNCSLLPGTWYPSPCYLSKHNLFSQPHTNVISPNIKPFLEPFKQMLALSYFISLPLSLSFIPSLNFYDTLICFQEDSDLWSQAPLYQSPGSTML